MPGVRTCPAGYPHSGTVLVLGMQVRVLPIPGMLELYPAVPRAVTYHFFHWKKGTPFSEDQGIYNKLTWWEQMDNGKQLTRNRKFLTVVPLVLLQVSQVERRVKYNLDIMDGKYCWESSTCMTTHYGMRIDASIKFLPLFPQHYLCPFLFQAGGN
eukprot:Gb_23564 [translate_table: standard]